MMWQQHGMPFEAKSMAWHTMAYCGMYAYEHIMSLYPSYDHGTVSTSGSARGAWYVDISCQHGLLSHSQKAQVDMWVTRLWHIPHAKECPCVAGAAAW